MINLILELIGEYWNAAIEILLLAVAIYYGYLYFRGTRGAKVLTGLAILFITLTLVSQILNLTVISWLLRSLTAFVAIALVVIFQPAPRTGGTGQQPAFFDGDTEEGDHRYHYRCGIRTFQSVYWGVTRNRTGYGDSQLCRKRGKHRLRDVRGAPDHDFFSQDASPRWRRDHSERPDHRGSLHLSGQPTGGP